ncbi:MAG: HEAT repeat domain-containing protein [Verrucomicrobia bacterium]|nr:HEAT repeat domain-containing protein [Verrucomicrobiota bacterium]
MSALVARADTNEQLTPADIQSLLAFISAPKPGELTDGEWEERVNVVLNLLRRQTEDVETEDRRREGAGTKTQDFKTQDAREDRAGSLASSLADDGHRPPLQGVPGLTEVLLEMAERNGSKVLRLYAMQHLSLWFGKERDPAKRRAMVGLLEKLATTPGDETAGCAVLMLADVRRQTQDGKTQDAREEGAGSLAGSLSGAGHGVTAAATENPSATPSATSASLRFVSADDGIDWVRVDGVLETTSRRLVGEAGAGVDVRISAVHACVDRKDAGALPDLRKVAADPLLVSTLRKAAIHAIGQLGTAEDMALLDSLPQDDPNLSQALTPAKAALATRKKEAR